DLQNTVVLGVTSWAVSCLLLHYASDRVLSTVLCWRRTAPQERVFMQTCPARITSCWVSSTLAWARDIRLKRMNWPTQQSFFCKAILDAPKKRVCSHVDSFAVRLRSNYLTSSTAAPDNPATYPCSCPPASLPVHRTATKG